MVRMCVTGTDAKLLYSPFEQHHSPAEVPELLSDAPSSAATAVADAKEASSSIARARDVGEPLERYAVPAATSAAAHLALQHLLTTLQCSFGFLALVSARDEVIRTVSPRDAMRCIPIAAIRCVALRCVAVVQHHMRSRLVDTLRCGTLLSDRPTTDSSSSSSSAFVLQ